MKSKTQQKLKKMSTTRTRVKTIDDNKDIHDEGRQKREQKLVSFLFLSFLSCLSLHLDTRLVHSMD